MARWLKVTLIVAGSAPLVSLAAFEWIWWELSGKKWVTAGAGADAYFRFAAEDIRRLLTADRVI